MAAARIALVLALFGVALPGAVAARSREPGCHWRRSAEGPPPAGLDEALAWLESADARERIAGAFWLEQHPDPRALPRLTALAEAADVPSSVDAQEERWEAIARATAPIARLHALPVELADFLESLVDRKAETLCLPYWMDYPRPTAQHQFAWAAKSALAQAAQREAELTLDAELAWFPTGEHAAHVALAAWPAAQPELPRSARMSEGLRRLVEARRRERRKEDPRAIVARERLHTFGAAGIAAARVRAPEADPERLTDLIGFLEKGHALAPDDAVAGLLAIARRDTRYAPSSALWAFAQLRPPNAAASIVEVLSQPQVEPDTFQTGLSALEQLGDVSAVPFLARKLVEQPRHMDIGRTLASLGEPGAGALLAAVQSHGEELRWAALALAEIATPAAREEVWRVAETTKDAHLRASLLRKTAEQPTPEGVDRAAQEARLRAIDRMAREPGPARSRLDVAPVLETIGELLGTAPTDARERDAIRLHAARAVQPLAFSLHVPDELAARLRELAQGGARTPSRAAADHAVRAVDCARARCALADYVRSLGKEDRVRVLAALAWSAGPKPSDPWRVEAQRLLAEEGPDGAAAARAILTQASAEDQRSIVYFLGQLVATTPAPDGVDAILDATESEDPIVRQTAFGALHRSATPELAERLVARARAASIPDSDYAGRVVEVLERLRDPAGVPYIAAQLAHPDPRVQAVAGRALTRIVPEGRDLLVERAGSDDPALRRTAVIALAELRRDRRARRAVRLAVRDHAGDFDEATLVRLRREE